MVSHHIRTPVIGDSYVRTAVERLIAAQRLRMCLTNVEQGLLQARTLAARVSGEPAPGPTVCWDAHETPHASRVEHADGESLCPLHGTNSMPLLIDAHTVMGRSEAMRRF